MEILVRNIDFSYDDEYKVLEANVRIESNSKVSSSNLSGYFKLSGAEYEASDKSLASISGIIKAKIKSEMFPEIA